MIVLDTIDILSDRSQEFHLSIADFHDMLNDKNIYTPNENSFESYSSRENTIFQALKLRSNRILTRIIRDSILNYCFVAQILRVRFIVHLRKYRLRVYIIKFIFNFYN